MLLKVLEIWALVSLELVLGLEVWLILRVFASWLSILAHYSLVLPLQQDFDYEQVEEVGLLDVRLVVGLVAEASSQLELLSIEMIIGLETGKTVQPGWIAQDGDLGDNQPLW